jgi:hypothetical protein
VEADAQAHRRRALAAENTSSAGTARAAPLSSQETRDVQIIGGARKTAPATTDAGVIGLA